MLIDDDFATNLFHKLVLDEMGCTEHIVIKYDAESALEYLLNTSSVANPRPDLIFLDVNMPRMNGWEFLDAYHQISARQKTDRVIIMLSTSSNPDDLRRANDHPDVREFRSKPLSGEMLEDIISQICEEESSTKA
jgi:CheY-like chemotaxis protein